MSILLIAFSTRCLLMYMYASGASIRAADLLIAQVQWENMKSCAHALHAQDLVKQCQRMLSVGGVADQGHLCDRAD